MCKVLTLGMYNKWEQHPQSVGPSILTLGNHHWMLSERNGLSNAIQAKSQAKFYVLVTWLETFLHPLWFYKLRVGLDQGPCTFSRHKIWLVLPLQPSLSTKHTHTHTHMYIYIYICKYICKYIYICKWYIIYINGYYNCLLYQGHIIGKANKRIWFRAPAQWNHNNASKW
jgi:hypothetical protein